MSSWAEKANVCWLFSLTLLCSFDGDNGAMNMSWSRHSKFPHPANKDSSHNLLFFHYQVLFNALQGIKLEHTTHQITKFANQKHIFCQIWSDSRRVVLVWFWFDVILLAVCTGKSGWKSDYLPHHAFPIFSCFDWREPLETFFWYIGTASLANGDDEKHKNCKGENSVVYKLFSYSLREFPCSVWLFS